MLLCALFAGLLSGCAKQSAANTIYITDSYSSPLSQLFPEYKTAEYNVKTALDALRS